MIRIVLQNVLLFLLPTLLYIGYRMLIERGPGSLRRALDEAPIGWLVASGVSVVAVFIAFFASYSGGRPGQIYVPPVMKDGKIVPGHYIDDAASDGQLRPGDRQGN
ncbi:MAG: DUF6111 family protein [Hyphomicrobiaceae bacterium]